MKIKNSPKVAEAGCCGYSKKQGRIILKIRPANGATIRFWQQENHPIELVSNKLLTKNWLAAANRYIHENPAGGVPLKAGLVDEPWEYRYSSARDYMNNQKGLLEVELI